MYGICGGRKATPNGRGMAAKDARQQDFVVVCDTGNTDRPDSLTGVPTPSLPIVDAPVFNSSMPTVSSTQLHQRSQSYTFCFSYNIMIFGYAQYFLLLSRYQALPLGLQNPFITSWTKPTLLGSHEAVLLSPSDLPVHVLPGEGGAALEAFTPSTGRGCCGSLFMAFNFRGHGAGVIKIHGHHCERQLVLPVSSQ